MADEKVIRIVTEGDSKGQDPGVEAQKKAAILAAQQKEAAEAQMKAHQQWVQSQTQAFTAATAPWQPAGGNTGGQGQGQGTGRGRGRPRSPYTPPPAPPFPPGGGNPTPPPIAGGGQQGASGGAAAAGPFAGVFKDAFKQVQKFVTAIDGVNGHMTKTLAALSRFHKLIETWVKNFSIANRQALAAGHTQSKLVTVVSNAWAKVGSSVKFFGTIVGTAALAVGALALSAKLLTRFIESLQEVVGEFSGALQVAKAQTEIQIMQARIRSASRIGGELASLERVNADLKEQLIELKTNVIDAIYPAIQQVGAQLAMILKVVNMYLAFQNRSLEILEKGLEFLIEMATHIPWLGKAAKKALNWMQQDEVGNVKDSDAFNKQLEDIFLDINVFPGNSRKAVPKQFLP